MISTEPICFRKRSIQGESIEYFVQFCFIDEWFSFILKKSCFWACQFDAYEVCQLCLIRPEPCARSFWFHLYNEGSGSAVVDDNFASFLPFKYFDKEVPNHSDDQSRHQDYQFDVNAQKAAVAKSNDKPDRLPQSVIGEGSFSSVPKNTPVQGWKKRTRHFEMWIPLI